MVADSPETTCRKSGRKITPANRATPVRKPRAEPSEKIELANSRIGRSGSGTRVSHQTNPAIPAIPAVTRPSMTGDVHAYSGPTPGQRQQQAGHTNDQQQRAFDVDPVRATGDR